MRCVLFVSAFGGAVQAYEPILKAARRGNVTLLYSARDTEHNSALVLKAYLDKLLEK
jgi:uncharacterized protein YeaO (DUF488 family)